MIKQFLQGRPFGHPLHPALVHFPIGLFLLSFLFDAATIFGSAGNGLVRGAFYTLLAGVVMALLAAVPGLADYWDIRRDHRSWSWATTHMLLNLTAVALYGLSLAFRYPRLDGAATATLPFLLALAGLALVAVSGFLGGYLVYSDGVAVGRHRRRTDLPSATVTVEAGEVGQFVPVAAVDQISEGATLRAEVGHQVMVIAQVEGKLYAFQEFCTHRYGPLSEGHFSDHQVECPWHRSCFDVRTGQVTEGPATASLRTFAVRVNAGMIEVQLPYGEAARG